MEIVKILNSQIPPSKLIIAASGWIFFVLTVSFAGLFFTHPFLNVLVTGSVYFAIGVIITMIPFCRMHILCKVLLSPILLLAFLFLAVSLFLFSIEFCESWHGRTGPFHRCIKSERLGSANLVVYKYDMGATVESSLMAELEKPFWPGIKRVEPVGSGGCHCDIELVRIDEHHIRCICTSYEGTSHKVLSDDIITDL